MPPRKRRSAVAEAIGRRLGKSAGAAGAGASMKAGLHEDASPKRPLSGAGLGKRGKGKAR